MLTSAANAFLQQQMQRQQQQPQPTAPPQPMQAPAWTPAQAQQPWAPPPPQPMAMTTQSAPAQDGFNIPRGNYAHCVPAYCNHGVIKRGVCAKPGENTGRPYAMCPLDGRDDPAVKAMKDACPLRFVWTDEPYPPTPEMVARNEAKKKAAWASGAATKRGSYAGGSGGGDGASLAVLEKILEEVKDLKNSVSFLALRAAASVGKRRRVVFLPRAAFALTHNPFTQAPSTMASSSKEQTRALRPRKPSPVSRADEEEEDGGDDVIVSEKKFARKYDGPMKALWSAYLDLIDSTPGLPFDSSCLREGAEVTFPDFVTYHWDYAMAEPEDAHEPQWSPSREEVDSGDDDDEVDDAIDSEEAEVGDEEAIDDADDLEADEEGEEEEEEEEEDARAKVVAKSAAPVKRAKVLGSQ